MNRKVRPFPLLPLALAAAASLALAAPARADSLAIGFEPPAYALGSIDGQDGWGGSNPPGIAINPSIDQEVSAAAAHTGAQSFRMSSDYTSGAFGNQVFSPSLTDRAGEVSSVANGLAGGTVQQRFTATIWFRSATAGAQDSHVVISPDRGDGARMSWVQVSDNVVDPGDGRQGLSVSFYDYRASAVDFVFQVVATNLDRTQWHRIDLSMDFFEGPANDIVQVSVDGGPVTVGTSWEDYFRDQEGNPTRPVDSLLFRVAGGAEGNAGEGFFFDDVAYASSACASATRWVATTGDDTFNDCATAGSPCVTIQHAVDVACAGDTIEVAAGTYAESPRVNKSVTLHGTSGRDLTSIALQTAPTYLGALSISGTDVTLDGFTIVGRDGTSNGSNVIAATNVLIENNLAAVDSVVIRNCRFRVGLPGSDVTTGDDGFALVTTYDQNAVTVNALTIEDSIIEPLNAAAQRAFYVNPGVGTFTFQRNEVTGKFNGTAITQAQNSLVEDNTVDGQGLGGTGLGVWGYPDSNVWGHATFRGNTFTGLLRGIWIIEANDVEAECNELEANGTGIAISDGFGSSNFDPTTIDLHDNAIAGNTTAGAASTATTPGFALAENNWWGCVSGPGNVGCDAVSGDIDFTPFATAPPVCTGGGKELNVTRARLKRNTSGNPAKPNGLIRISGDMVVDLPGGDVLSVAAGMALRVVDGLGLDTDALPDPPAWAPTDCVAKNDVNTGVVRTIQCKTPDKAYVATIRAVNPIVPATAQVYKFTFTLKKLPIVAPFDAPVTATMSQGAVDRIGTIDDCRSNAAGLSCKEG